MTDSKRKDAVVVDYNPQNSFEEDLLDRYTDLAFSGEMDVETADRQYRRRIRETRARRRTFGETGFFGD